MGDIIRDFIEELVKDALSFFGDAISSGTESLMNRGFHAEEILTGFLGSDISGIYTVIQAFALYMIVLKFLKKGFDTYILWNDGDSDLDPFIMLTGFFKAIVVTLCFGTIYNVIVDIATDLINQLLEKVTASNGADISMAGMVTNIVVMGIAGAIVAIIFFIFYLIFCYKYIKKGLELFILKVGVSFACIGLIDSDGGVFKTYLKKFFQEIFGIVLQIICLKIALFLVFTGHYIYGFSCMGIALTAPQFLGEFIMTSGNGGGVMNRISSGMYMASMAKNFTK